MKAAVVDKYGPPEAARVIEVPRPATGRGEVLVRVRSAAVTTGDARVRGARFPQGFGPMARLMFGITAPRRKILGSTFSGVVEEAGADVDGLQPGDSVCGSTGAKMGAHAEYVAIRATKLVDKPPTLGHEDAAGLLFGGSAAWHFLRTKAKLRADASILVNGASGAVGTNAVQLARHFGAAVTAVTSSANAELVAGLGADRVVDYTKEPVAQLSDRFDVVFDAVGGLSIEEGRRLLADGGVFVLVAASLGENVRARGNVIAGPAPERRDYFESLLRLAADCSLRTIIDHVFDLADIADAYARVDSGHKVGNVVLRM